MLLGDNRNRDASAPHFDRLENLVSEGRVLPRLCGVSVDHQEVGLLRQTAAGAASGCDRLLAMLPLSEAEGPSETKAVVLERRNQRLLCHGKVGYQPLLEKANFRFVDRAVCDRTSGDSNRLVNLA
jgi:hypothetical protein